MLITLRVMKVNKEIKMEATPEELISDVRQRLATQLEVQPNQLKIIADGKILKPEQTLAQCHISENTKINVAITKATAIEAKSVAPVSVQAQSAPAPKP